MSMEPVTAVVLGAGARGRIYADYAKAHPEEIRIVAVAEPKADRRARFARDYGLPEAACYADWAELLAQPKLADAALICTMDHLHYAPCMEAISRGYQILLEKPMSPSAAECAAMQRAAEEKGVVLAVCHVLRYTPFFSKIKQLIEDGTVGRVQVIEQTEHVCYWHQAHSFVRGNWGDTRASTPMILQKCCHDTDILTWLIGQRCVRVASYGALTHFTAQNAPEGAPARCLDGCPHSGSCPYYAPRFYLEHPKARSDGFCQMLCADPTRENLLQALRTGPYGRCIYRCGSDAVDHQAVCMEFEDGAVATLMMCAFTEECNRTLHLMGTKAELWGDMERGQITVQPLGGEPRPIPVKAPQTRYAYNHSGGDYCLIRDFVRAVAENDPGSSRSSAAQSLQSHLICFAAERARSGGRGCEL